MEIIPAIDLLQGNCVRLNQGDYNKVTQFNPDPVSQALTWQEKGAKRLHLVDLDGAKTGEPINNEAIKAITKSLTIPIQIGGGVRTKDRAKELLDYGIDKVILGTIAIEAPELVNEIVSNHPNKIIIGLDSKEGKVATRGWLKQSEVKANEIAREFSNLNIASIICTDITTDGTLKGPNLKALKEIAKVSKIPIIASGGVGSIADLLSLIPLESYGVKGVIVGRALYDGTIDLEEAINSISTPRMQDPPKEGTFLA